MAPPPKASSPPNPAAPEKDRKSAKVTPLQVAFLVEHYLADNGFSASLDAFRSDAAHLFARPSKASIVPPKGLLPLAEILHDYITLKESRVAVDSAMQAMHGLVSSYYLSHPLPAPPLGVGAMLPQPSSPPLVPPLFVGPNTSSPPQPQLPPPSGTAGYATPIIQYAQTSSVVVQSSSDGHNTSIPGAISLHSKKRKATKPVARTTLTSKKTCTAPTTSSQPKGKTVASQQPIDIPAQNKGSSALPSSAEHTVIAKLPVQGTSVAKSLFNSSPCTPDQGHSTGDESASCKTQRPSVHGNDRAQQEFASSQCSIVSSKTLIVSPLKGGTYSYSVERSFHVSSPLKPSTQQKSSKREHVKGKLNFDSSDARPGSELICEETSTSVGEKQEDFVDFTNLDIFDTDFSFSEVLLDFDLDNEGVDYQNASTNVEAQRLEPIAENDYVTPDPVLSDSVKPMVADPTEDVYSQETTSVTSVRAITKRIKIVSPVKGRAASYGSK